MKKCMYWLPIYCIGNSPLYWISIEEMLDVLTSNILYWKLATVLDINGQMHGVLAFIENSPLYWISIKEMDDIFAFNVLY